MALQDISRRAGPFSWSSSRTYSFGFKVFATDQVAVTVLRGSTEIVLASSSYSVTLNADQENQPGGTVTLIPSIGVSDRVVITSAVPYTQEMVLTNQGGFYPDILNENDDRIVAQIQQLREGLDRAIKVGPTSSKSAAEYKADLEDVVNAAAEQASASDSAASDSAASASDSAAAAAAAQAAAEDADEAASDAKDAAVAAKAALDTAVASIPGIVTSEVDGRDIPGLVADEVSSAITAQDIPQQVEDEVTRQNTEQLRETVSELVGEALDEGLVDALGYTPANDDAVVKHAVQSLSASQKQQARLNVDAYQNRPLLLVVAGQSNAMGNASDYTNAGYEAPTCWHFQRTVYADASSTDYSGEWVRGLAEPVGNGGGFMSSLAEVLHRRTGREVFILNVAFGSSIVTDITYSGESWSSSGRLRDRALGFFNSATASMPVDSYDILGTVWLQGESDSTQLTAEAETLAQYKSGIEDVVSWFKSNIGGEFFISSISYMTPYSGGVGNDRNLFVEQVNDVMANLTGAHLATSVPKTFRQRGLLKQDGIHYMQAAYDEVGVAFAGYIADYLERKKQPVVLNVRDFKAVGDGIADDRDAFMRALKAAGDAGGGVVFVPPGKYRIKQVSNDLYIYSNTTLLGVGDASEIFWDDQSVDSTDSNAKRMLYISSGASGVHFRNLKISSTLDSFPTSEEGATAIVTQANGSNSNIIFDNVTFSKLRKMAVQLSGSDMTVVNCRCDHVARDGFHFDYCSNIKVLGCSFKAVADDAVAFNAHGNDGFLVSGCAFIESQGIRIQNARGASVVNNVFQRALRKAVNINGVPVGSMLGYAHQFAYRISGNLFIDTINSLSGSGVQQVVSIANGISTGAAGNTASPDDVSIAGETTDVVPLDGISIDHNVFTWRLPTGSSVNYSDYGFGDTIFDRGGTGYTDPVCTDDVFSCIGVQLQGAMRNVRITNNRFAGAKVSSNALGNPAIFFRDDENSPAKMMLEDVLVQGNSFHDWPTSDCVRIAYPSTTGFSINVNIKDNHFNLDPYFRHQAHSEVDNTWSSASACTAINSSAGSSGMAVCTANHIWNCSRAFSGNISRFDNYIYFQPSGAGVGDIAANKGVRVVSATDRNICCVIDGGPASTSYGVVTTLPVKCAASVPTSGTYIRGHFVENTGYSSTIYNNVRQTVLGWKRLTTGSSHVDGTDWRALYAEG